MELEVKIIIESTIGEALPIGKGMTTEERTVIRDRMSWLELQELKARLTPASDV